MVLLGKIMTYNQIQEEYRHLYNKSIKSCWIADAKRELGLTKRVAPNRIDKNSAKYPCPKAQVKEAIKRLILGSNR